jgi:hypothetical protein
MSGVQGRASGLLICLFFVAGCASDEATPTASTPVPAAPAKPQVTQTPEAAVQAVVEGLKASKPVVVWDTLANNARRSINDTVSNTAAAIDPEVWDRSVANLKKLVTLLETKKEFLWASPLWKTGQLPKLDTVKASWDPAVKLLRIAVDSELVDQKQMKIFNGQKFLEGTGAKLFAQMRAAAKTMKPDPIAFLDDPKITVTKKSETSAQVSIQLPGSNAKPLEFGLGVIDGKWSSQQLNMAANFGGIYLTGFVNLFRPYEMLEWKPAYLKDMDRLGQIIDKLQATKTSDEFQAAMVAQALPFLLQKAGQLRAKRPEPTRMQNLSWERKAGTTIVIVKGLHSFDETTYSALAKSLRAASPETILPPNEVAGDTLFVIGPGPAFDTVVQAIQVGKIVAKDKLRDTVTVELPTSLNEEKSTADAGAVQK